MFSRSFNVRKFVTALCVALAFTGVVVSGALAQGINGAAIDPTQYTPNELYNYGPQYPDNKVAVTVTVYDQNARQWYTCQARNILCGDHGRLVVKKKLNRVKLVLGENESVVYSSVSYVPADGQQGWISFPMKGRSASIFTDASISGTLFPVQLQNAYVAVYNSTRGEPKQPVKGGGCDAVVMDCK
jgi:hypothetical protein